MKTKKNFLKKLTAGILGFVMTLGVGAAGYSASANESKAAIGDVLINQTFGSKPSGWGGSGTGTYSGHGLKFDGVGDSLTTPSISAKSAKKVSVEIKSGYNGNKGSVFTISAINSSGSVLGGTTPSATVTPAVTYTSPASYTVTLDCNNIIDKIEIKMTSKTSNLSLELVKVVDQTTGSDPDVDSISISSSSTVIIGKNSTNTSITYSETGTGTLGWTHVSGDTVVSNMNLSNNTVTITTGSSTGVGVYKLTKGDASSDNFTVCVADYHYNPDHKMFTTTTYSTSAVDFEVDNMKFTGVGYYIYTNGIAYHAIYKTKDYYISNKEQLSKYISKIVLKAQNSSSANNIKFYKGDTVGSITTEVTPTKSDGDATLTYNLNDSKFFKIVNNSTNYVNLSDIAIILGSPFASFNVTYNANAGTDVVNNMPQPATGVTEHTISSLVPTRTNYEFDSWNTKNDGTGQTYNAGTVVYSELTLYAIWIQKFNVTYYPNANGDTVNNMPSNVTGVTSHTISSNIPTRTHYVFSHWNTQANDTGTTYSAGTVVKQGLSLYAIWSDTYTVSFNAHGGTGEMNDLEDRITIDSAPACTFTAPNKKSFSYWADSNGNKINFPLTLTADTTFYATWASDPQSGTYVLVEESLTDWSGRYLIVYTAGEIAWTGIDNTNEGVDVTITNKKISGVPEGAATFVVASMQGGGYSIQVSGGTNDGKYVSGNSSNGVTYGNSAVANTLSYDASQGSLIFSNSSYLRYNYASNQNRFRFYKTSSYSSQQKVDLYKLDDGPAKFTLTFNANGGQFVEGTKTSYEVVEGNSQALLTSSVVSKTGYTLSGWSLTQENQVAVSDPYTPTEDNQTLYAMWTVNKYTVHVTNSSTVAGNVTYTDNSSDGKAAYGINYVGNITFNNGAVLESMSIKVGSSGTELYPTAYSNNKITIAGTSILDDIYISFKAEVPQNYSITNNLTYINTSNLDTTIEAGGTYSATLSVADSSFVFDTVTVKKSGVDITSTAYKSSTHTIEISNVDGDIVITAIGRFTGTITLDDSSNYSGWTGDPTIYREVVSTTGFDTANLKYLWTSSNTSLARITDASKDDAKATIQMPNDSPGTATITVTVTDGIDGHEKSVSFTITLSKSEVKSIETDVTSIELDTTNVTSATVKPTVTKVGNKGDTVDVEFSSTFVALSVNGQQLASGDEIPNNSVVTVAYVGATGTGSITFYAHDARSVKTVVSVEISKAKTTYYLIEDVSQLVPGMTVIIGSAAAKTGGSASSPNVPTVAGEANTGSTKTNQYLVCDQSDTSGTVYDETNHTFRTSIAQEYELELSGDYWKLKTSQQKYLSADADKQLGFDRGGTSDFSIAIDETTHAASIKAIASSDYGIIRFNNGSPRFSTYTSTGQMAAVELYAKANDLSSVAVNGMTTSYTVGDSFTFDGTVTASFTGNGSVGYELPSDAYAVSSVDMSTSGTKDVTITYEYLSVGCGKSTKTTKTATYQITVAANEKTVSYSCDVSADLPDDTPYEVGKTVSVTSTVPVKAGYKFLGWSDGKGHTYQSGGTFTMPNENVTLTATWEDKAVAASGITLGCGLNFKYGIKNGVLELDDDEKPVIGSLKMRFSASMNETAATKYATGYTFGMILIESSNIPQGKTLPDLFRECDYDKANIKAYGGKAASFPSLPDINPATGLHEFGANLTINVNDLESARSQNWVCMWYAINVTTGQFEVTGCQTYNLSSVCEAEYAKTTITSIEKDVLKYIGGF